MLAALGKSYSILEMGAPSKGLLIFCQALLGSIMVVAGM